MVHGLGRGVSRVKDVQGVFGGFSLLPFSMPTNPNLPILDNLGCS